MDKIPALKQAHALSSIHGKCIEIVSALQRTKDNGGGELKSAQRWQYELQERLRALHPLETDSTGIQSKSNELRSSLTSQCEDFSRQVTQTLQKLAEFSSTPQVVDALELSRLYKMVQSIGNTLNNSLARIEWVSIAESIRELGGKNARLGANRVADINNLSDRVDQQFRVIVTTSSSSDSKTTAWQAVIDLLPRVVDFTLEQTILTTLQFWTMDQRKELIEKEYEDTFGWILADKDFNGVFDQAARCFVDWLGSDEALYWISGKPGSGKSTLMKYISESPKARDILKGNWSKNEKLVMAEFYFWSSAKDSLQKSGTGLMRSILFQILRQCPDMIQHAYTKEWQGRYGSQEAIRKLVREGQTLQELLDTFIRISAMLPDSNTKFCFFIDGLDEFDGDPADICSLVASLKSIRNLKLCVSSRQWVQFEEVFGGDNPWRVYIHEKTMLDMEKYVRGFLAPSGNSTADDNEITVLVKAIAEKAEGVFLWSFLAVRALIGAIPNIETDNLVTLMKTRLQDLPGDLDGYFNMMFQSTLVDMRPKTAQVFQTALEAVEKLPLLCYWLIETEDLENVLKCEHSSELESRPQVLSNALKDLRKFSKGLLHVKGALKTDSIPAEVLEADFYFGFRVDFIHRTAADFLYTSEMRQLFSRWKTASYDVDLAICKASIAILEDIPCAPYMFDDGSCALSILHLGLSHAKNVEVNLQRQILESVFKALQRHVDANTDISMKILGPGNFWAYGFNFRFIFLYHCVSYNLSKYVTSQLDAKELQPRGQPSGLLSACFSWDNRVKSGQFTLCSDTVKGLLQAGLDPNLPWGDRDFSFWQQLLTSTYSRHLKGITNGEDFAAIKYAVEHGADLGAEVEILARRSAGGVKAVELLDKILPEEQKDILRKA